jgi:hypothetical protein
VKQPKRDLLERLEGAAQACHAAMILSCEATCREAAQEIERLRKLKALPTEELSPSVRRLLLDLYEARMNDTVEVNNERLKLISDLLGIEAFACVHPYHQCSRWCGVEARCTVAFRTNPSPRGKQ